MNSAMVGMVRFYERMIGRAAESDVGLLIRDRFLGNRRRGGQEDQAMGFFDHAEALCLELAVAAGRLGEDDQIGVCFASTVDEIAGEIGSERINGEFPAESAGPLVIG